MLKILVVCLGNICRSPAAEGILRHKLLQAGWEEGIDFELDSAGTGGWHLGQAPDPRSVQVCQAHGIEIASLQARQLVPADGKRFDVILGMDYSNLDNIKGLLETSFHGKVQLFDQHEVNDPYYSAFDGFEIMFQQLDLAADKWVKRWQGAA